MFNKQIATVLSAAKKQNKWVPVKYLLPYGLFPGNVVYLEDRGHINTTHHDEMGTMISLTVDGYHTVQAFINPPYTKESVHQ